MAGRKDWFNDGVAVHLSSLADRAADHLEFATFPRDGGTAGLVVSVPTAAYLLALKLKAFRILDATAWRGGAPGYSQFDAGSRHIDCAEQAMALLGRYFPVSAASSEKQRFLLKNMNRGGASDAPKYPR